MTTEEFSNGFDTLVNSYKRFKSFDNKENLDSIEFNEYEKSLFLTQAQESVIINMYNGKNPFGDSFESTEEIRRYLNNLIKTKEYNSNESIDAPKLTDKSLVFKLNDDVAFITLEQIIYNDKSLGCADKSVASVYPVTHDEYNIIKDNPFRGVTKYKALRLDVDNGYVEIIPKYTIGKYIMKYLSKPTPIVLTDLPEELSIDGVNIRTECTLNSVLHNNILEVAVNKAMSSLHINNDDRDYRRNYNRD